LEDHFKDAPLVVAGEIETVARLAEELHLAITTHGCGLVRDQLAPLVRITIDQTDEAINTLFPRKFV
jgi:hypothetical protein